MADANTRPAFYLPFPQGTSVSIKSYPGHNPDDKKMDMYAAGWPGVVAAAPGKVIESFNPGGLEVRHFIPGTQTLGNWYTTYMHMSAKASVGTILDQGEWLGTPGNVGTGAKHLHFEELHDAQGAGNAQTSDMAYPSFVEYNGGNSFHVPVGEPGLSLVSQNGSSAPPTPTPTPPPGGGLIHQGAPVPGMIAQGSGYYFGSISGPNESLGGYNDSEKGPIRMLQQRLIACGFVPGIGDPNDGWADGIYDTPEDAPNTGETSQAVTRFQQVHMPGTEFYGQCWWDDWTKLFNLTQQG